MMDYKRICRYCKKPFTPNKGGHNALYCSKSCKLKFRWVRVDPDPIICKHCNEPFIPKKTGRFPIFCLKCRPNARRYHFELVKNNPIAYKEHLDKSRDAQRKNYQWLSEYKISKGCIDCGYNKHSAALQIDHEGEKTFSISQLRSNKTRFMKEIENGKCVVRCAICHAVRTWANKNKIEYKPEMAR